MSVATLILGSSGSGKSTSLRNLDPAKTLLIQCIKKPLPFRATGWKTRITLKSEGNVIQIAKSAWNVFNAAGDLSEHRRVYIMAHTQSDETGQIRMKTVGKMVDSMIVPEGYFTIVLRTDVINGNYKFATQINGQDCAKSPMGMFSDTQIDNDLAAIDEQIQDFYQLSQPA